MRSVSVRRTVTILASALALAGAAASPDAAAPRTIELVNLGDSYSAAIGTGATTSAPFGKNCLQGEGPDHVSALDEEKRVRLLLDAACSGATTERVQEIASQKPVRAALAEADLVTLTLGGNDVEWTDYLQACSVEGEATAPEGTCDALLRQAQTRIDAAALSAGDTVRTIDEATPGRIVVLGYPHLFDGERDTAFFSAERAAQLNTLTDALNAALAEAVTDHRCDVIFVDVSERFEGHGADSTDPWIYFNPSVQDDPNNLHPNESGYLSGYYTALESAVSLGRLGR